MILQGKKIILRSVELTDTDTLFKWENDRSNWPVSGTKRPFTKKEIKDFIINQKDIYLDKQLRMMICLLQPPALSWFTIGCIDLFDFDQPDLKAGVGILIEKKYRKNGYASDALSLLIKYCFEILHLKQLNCIIDEENISSIMLFQKLKFKIIKKQNGMHSLQLISSLRRTK